MSTDPLTYALGIENLWLRELLEQVARDLEGISARDQYAAHTEALLRRSMRIRAHLSRGPGRGEAEPSPPGEPE